MLTNDARFLSKIMVTDLKNGLKRIEDNQFKLISKKTNPNALNPILQQCFDTEEYLRYVSKHIWNNEEFNQPSKKLNLLIHTFALHNERSMKEIEIKDKHRISCSLYTENTKKVFAHSCFENVGYLIKPNDSFLCACPDDAVSYEIPHPYDSELDKFPGLQNPLALVYKENETKVFVQRPQQYYNNCSFTKCSKLTTPSRLKGNDGQTDHYNEVILDIAKIKKEAVCVLRDNPEFKEHETFATNAAIELAKKENLPLMKVEDGKFIEL
ncbi:MAG: hypothetical protein LBG88_01795 [Christensenellaceae bacterium]|nr:hypothetical protein [Christensenellaceae bacterium]